MYWRPLVPLKNLLIPSLSSHHCSARFDSSSFMLEHSLSAFSHLPTLASLMQWLAGISNQPTGHSLRNPVLLTSYGATIDHWGCALQGKRFSFSPHPMVTHFIKLPKVPVRLDPYKHGCPDCTGFPPQAPTSSWHTLLLPVATFPNKPPMQKPLYHALLGEIPG